MSLPSRSLGFLSGVMKCFNSGYILTIVILALGLFSSLSLSAGGGGGAKSDLSFPTPLEDYTEMEAKRAAELGVDREELGIIEILKVRAAADPLNWIATLLFSCNVPAVREPRRG